MEPIQWEIRKFRELAATELYGLLRQAIESTEEDSGWAALGPVGSHISNKTASDGKEYNVAFYSL